MSTTETKTRTPQLNIPLDRETRAMLDALALDYDPLTGNKAATIRALIRDAYKAKQRKESK